MNDLWNQFVNWFNNLKNQATTWGKNAIQGLIDGIKGQITAAGNAAADIANQIASKLGFHSPPPEGPASDSDQWMPNMIDMMASGLRAGIPQIAGATSAIAGSLNPIGGSAAALPSGTSAISPSISSGSPTIIVNVPPSIVEMDGQRLTSVLMPYIVEAIRRDAAGRF
jgi:phage-related protein